MEQEILINPDEVQHISINENKPQTISLKNISLENINVNQTENQNININENDNQLIYIDENGSAIVINDILVNGVSVISNGIAYITVPTTTSELINDSGFITKDVNNLSYYTKTVNLSDVALSGDYDDLENKPTIPSVYNATLTIQKNNTTIDTFTANSNVDKTVNIDVPVNVSDLVNDEEFVTKDVDDLEYYTLSSALSEVATSGSYDDLDDLPVIPYTTSELTNDSGFINNEVNNLVYYTLSSNLSEVATTGDYDDLSNKPTIPTTTSELTNDSGFITDSYHDSTKQDTLISGTNIKTINNNSLLGSGNITISGGTATDVQINGTSITSGGTANIQTNGTYNSSTNKIATMSDIPSVPTKTSDLTNDSGFITKSVNDLTNYTLSSSLSSVATSGNYADLSNKPSIPTKTSDLNNDSGYITKSVNDLTNYTLSSALSSVATTGSYTDLSNKPSIPTNTSDLNNDSGYITKSVNDLTNYTLSSALSTVATTGSYTDLSNKPSIPTKTSDLTNDSGFITDSSLPQDSGWQSPTLTANFKDYNNSASNHPKYRKIGKIVTIQGIVTPTTSLSTTGDQTIFTLPSGYTPSLEIRTICQGSGMNRWMLSIFPNGNVCLARYGITSQDNVASGNWLPFYVTYMID